MTSKYKEAGVDPEKKGIEVFRKTINNLFPNAFCTVGKDPDFENRGILLHTDGAGSKPIQNYLHWQESGDINWFRSIAQDVIAMNIDDLICVGARGIGLVDYIATNQATLPKKSLLAELNSGFGETLELMKRYNIEVPFLGGETADLPDQLKTLDVSGTILGRVNLSKTISGAEIEPGNLIVGFRSGGQTEYEDSKNSGIMCNGITLARHALMNKSYEEKYSEISGGIGKGYYGKFDYDEYHEALDMNVGDAIISPTRLFAPVVTKILENHRPHINGMVHNTGGGQTKCLAIGKNIHYVKEDPIEPDPIFKLIQKESKESWKEMFRDFNMGTGFEIITEEEYAEDILNIAETFELEGKIIGKCEKSDKGNKVTIKSEFGDFAYMEKEG